MFYLYKLLLVLIIPTKIYVNIEKPNSIISHTGITFENNNEKIRYDFRAFNNNDDYITTEESRRNVTLMFPKIDAKILDFKGFNEFKSNISFFSKEVFLGETNYNLQEIIEYEKNMNKIYILGFYDCRHYVNELTKWCLNYSIPIWNLDSLL
tara:strand:- start:1404 stop:1859 length:456 start_codon:yes stop_codon:yes gene_type:complete